MLGFIAHDKENVENAEEDVNQCENVHVICSSIGYLQLQSVRKSMFTVSKKMFEYYTHDSWSKTKKKTNKIRSIQREVRMRGKLRKPTK